MKYTDQWGSLHAKIVHYCPPDYLDPEIIEVKGYECEVKYRTQKARGLQAIAGDSLQYRVFPIEKVEPLDIVSHFARPCPMRPRHGFVDSRYLETIPEAEKLIQETRDADPEAEIIAMDKIHATHSAIWTPGLLTIGQSNDGATLGKETLQIPCRGDSYPFLKYSLEAAGVKNSPYFELLWNGHENPIAVQLRDGPKLPESVNFIPKNVTIKNVITVNGDDLLQWEARMRSVQSGDVVYHPGGSLASHYAIHCVLNEIPVLIDREPQVGETLVKASAVRKIDVYQLRLGFMAGATAFMKETHAAYLMLAACHNVSKLKGRNDYLLGLGLGAAYRMVVTASLGEYRHVHGPNKKVPRNAVYSQVWDHTLEPLIIARQRRAIRSFADGKVWPSHSNFGGKKWYNVAVWALKIFNAVRLGQGTLALEILNGVTNEVHNGGWAFDKFISTGEMSQSCCNPVYPLLKAGPTVYDLCQLKPEQAVIDFLKRKTLKELPIKEQKMSPAVKSRPASIAAQAKTAYTIKIPQFPQFDPGLGFINSMVAYGTNGPAYGMPAYGTEKKFVVLKKKRDQWIDTYWAAGADAPCGKGASYAKAAKALKEAQNNHPNEIYKIGEKHE